MTRWSITIVNVHGELVQTVDVLGGIRAQVRAYKMMEKLREGWSMRVDRAADSVMSRTKGNNNG